MILNKIETPICAFRVDSDHGDKFNPIALINKIKEGVDPELANNDNTKLKLKNERGVLIAMLELADELVPIDSVINAQLHKHAMILFYELKFYMFSNFSSFAVEYDGRLWPTSEHAYQAMKFLDYDLQEEVRNERSAHTAMKLAQSKPEQYRPDWNEVKVPIMLEICRAKLQQHEYIQRKLMETGNRELIESSPVDSFWGWGPNKDGENHLGRVWMTLRDEWKEHLNKDKQ